MKYIFMVTKPKSNKAVIACEFASSAAEAVRAMIMTGPYLQEDILDNTDQRLLERDLIDEDQVKIKTCRGFFKITKMLLC